MPALSLITGKVDYSNLSFTVGDISIKYGSFLTAIIDFIIIALSIFIMIKYINKMQSKLDEINEKGKENVKRSKWFKKIEEKIPVKEEVEIKQEPTTKICPFCYSEINYKATRCPNCTSILEEKQEK